MSNYGGAQLKTSVGVNGESAQDRSSRRVIELEWLQLYYRRRRLLAEIDATERSMDVLECRLAESAKEGEG